MTLSNNFDSFILWHWSDTNVRSNHANTRDQEHRVILLEKDVRIDPWHCEGNTGRKSYIVKDKPKIARSKLYIFLKFKLLF